MMQRNYCLLAFQGPAKPFGLHREICFNIPFGVEDNAASPENGTKLSAHVVCSLCLKKADEPML